MEVSLLIQKGPARNQRIRLKASETIIGRSRDCDLCIPSAEVSRRHCLLTLGEGRLTVEDLTSANGTFLNKQRVSGIQPVKAGDQLQIGPLVFTIEVGKAPQPAVPAPDEPKGKKPVVNKTSAPKQPAAPKTEDAEPDYGLLDVVPVKPASPPEPVPVANQKTTPPPPKKESKEPAEDSLEIDLDDEDLLDLPKGGDFLDFLKMDQ